jgi:hypothetical protein
MFCRVIAFGFIFCQVIFIISFSPSWLKFWTGRSNCQPDKLLDSICTWKILNCGININDTTIQQNRRVAQWARSLDLTVHTSLSPIRLVFAPGFVIYKKWSTRLAFVSDKVYQLLAHGWWFSPGIPASSSTKTGRHYIADILLKVALNTKNFKKSNSKIQNFTWRTPVSLRIVMNGIHLAQLKRDRVLIK